VVCLFAGAGFLATAAVNSSGYTLVGWSDFGMNMIDSDYSIFALMPPGATLHAQLIDNTGKLVKTDSVITVTYEAYADPNGTSNSTSQTKTNFWTNAQALMGTLPIPDAAAMPGADTRKMTFDASLNRFTATGIPVTPVDDAGQKNPYPIFKLVAKDATGKVLATARVVLPVSDEAGCIACHASGLTSVAQPIAGWVNDPDPQRDYRLNILQRHDDRNKRNAAYADSLSAAGYSADGLFATATGGKPVLCVSCHASNLIAGSGQSGIPALTTSMHSLHAGQVDPDSGAALDDMTTRAACYRCHPGVQTKMLRGVMRNSVECQSCHGNLSMLGDAARQGWKDLPTCGSCHTGTAVNNRGTIHFTSAFDSTGAVRTPSTTTYATTPNTPASGQSLVRFSTGHGGLVCSACHGSTHAESPSALDADNLRATDVQNNAGIIGECTMCHSSLNVNTSTTSGPHGMHPTGINWVNAHPNLVGGRNGVSETTCAVCHGADYRGTELSEAFVSRSLSTKFGVKNFYRGFRVGCYSCHQGPTNNRSNTNSAPQVADADLTTAPGAVVTTTLTATDSNNDKLTLRVITPPLHGVVVIDGTSATYTPEPGFAADDSFTFAANDSQTDSNQGTVTIHVKQP